MEEYRSNSYKSRDSINEPVREKKNEKVVKGSVATRKKSLMQRFMSLIIPEDVESVRTYILEDVVVPTVKDAILDATKAILGINGRSTDRGVRRASKVSYGRYYDDDRRDYRRPASSGYSYDDVLLDNRGDAESVLRRMEEAINSYGIVSVADFYDFVGITGDYTDNKYGWTDIHSARVVRDGDKYTIRLPKALPID